MHFSGMNFVRAAAVWALLVFPYGSTWASKQGDVRTVTATFTYENGSKAEVTSIRSKTETLFFGVPLEQVEDDGSPLDVQVKLKATLFWDPRTSEPTE